MTRFGVDFASMMRPPSFAPQADQADTDRADAGMIRRPSRRRMAGLRRAADVLRHLPDEGESLHVILLGYFDLCHLILALLTKLGRPCETLRIATLSLSRRNISELAALLDAGQIRRLDVLTSDFQRKHDPEIMATLLEEICGRGQRIAAARSHCKLVLLALDDGQRYVLEGSANLRTSRNCEQICVSQSVELHRFYDRWLSAMVTKHEIGSNDNDAAR